MKRLLLTIASGALGASFGLAQTTLTPLEIAGLESPDDPVEFGTSARHSLALLRYGEAAGETTLLFVHTTLDVSVAGPLIARGVFDVYPFLDSDRNWAANDPAFANYIVENPSEELVLAPSRVVRHLERWRTHQPPEYFGTHSSTNTPTVNYVPPASWPATTAADARRPWTQNGLFVPANGAQAVKVGPLGRGAVFQAAHDYVLDYPQFPLSEASLMRLADIIDNELGYVIAIQAIHVRPPEAGQTKPRIRMSQVARVFRRALNDDPGDSWVKRLFRPRDIPSAIDKNVSVYLAPRGDDMHVVFPGPVSGLVAWVPTPSGWMEVPQKGPVFETGSDQPVRPEIARFAWPTAGLPSIVYFTKSGALQVPVNAMDRGALVWPFDPDQEPAPPQ